ncbi:YceI family protein [Neolewinella litorea]|nr:YceI family protein [Neolewinella litorea]
MAFLLTCLLWLPAGGTAQVHYEIPDNGQGTMRVSGTSTLHDWEMVTHEMTGTAEFVFAPKGKRTLTALQALTFALEVEDLKSDNKGLDKNAYAALMSDRHPCIRYFLSSATVAPAGEGFLLRTRGRLTVAGTTRDIQMDVRAVVNADASVTCTGAYTLNMTEYGVTPPSFMLGVMKTGELITLDFVVTYAKSAGV